jgi:transcription elongation factor SPT4
MPPPPQEFSKHTRACLRCKLVKTFDQFLTDGCENCETLNLKNNTELVSQWTTNAYSGYERANSFQNFNSLW